MRECDYCGNGVTEPGIEVRTFLATSRFEAYGPTGYDTRVFCSRECVALWAWPDVRQGYVAQIMRLQDVLDQIAYIAAATHVRMPEVVE